MRLCLSYLFKIIGVVCLGYFLCTSTVGTVSDIISEYNDYKNIRLIGNYSEETVANIESVELIDDIHYLKYTYFANSVRYTGYSELNIVNNSELNIENYIDTEEKVVYNIVENKKSVLGTDLDYADMFYENSLKSLASMYISFLIYSFCLGVLLFIIDMIIYKVTVFDFLNVLKLRCTRLRDKLNSKKKDVYET